jgi:hypothetical protein
MALMTLCLIFSCQNVASPDHGKSSDEGLSGSRALYAPPEQYLSDVVPWEEWTLPYNYGFAKAPGKPIPPDGLMNAYIYWRNTYVTSEGAGGYLRVQRDIRADEDRQMPSDTVSEGIAYGMLLAVYFNDQYTFDNLYMYSQLHTVGDGKRLMHWRVDDEGTDISEYGIPIGHGPLYVPRNVLIKDLQGIDGSPAGVIETNSIDQTEYHTNFYRDREGWLEIVTPEGFTNLVNNGFFLQLSEYGRENGSCAADADFDMAAALVMASAIWLPEGVDYDEEAQLFLTDMCANDFKSDGWIKNGNLWGDETVWNPSYFTPAWFKMLEQFAVDHDMKAEAALLALSYDVMYEELDSMMNTTVANGLFPDWVDSIATGKGRHIADGSDRYYYLDEDGDLALDDNNGDGIITTDDHTRYMDGRPGYALSGWQSYNFFYDAVRICWRMAQDYSWNGNETAKRQNNDINNFLRGSYPMGILDGYSVTGGHWIRKFRDGFNPGEGGVNAGSTTFVAMIGCTFQSLNWIPGINVLNSVWSNMEPTYEGEPNPLGKIYYGYHYYGNTLRMLSLVYIHGRMINLYEDRDRLTGVEPNEVILDIRNQTKTIDLSRGPATIIMYEYPDIIHFNQASGLSFNIKLENGIPEQTIYTGNQYYYQMTSGLGYQITITDNGGAEKQVIVSYDSW